MIDTNAIFGYTMFTNLFNTIYFIKNDNLWVYFVKNSLFFEKTVSCMYRKSLNFKKTVKNN